MPEGEWCMMQTNRDERACELARWIVENNATVRAAAKRFGISKSTVHKDLSERLRQIDRLLYEKVQPFSSRTRRNGTCAAATPPEENTCTPGRTSPKREKYTAEKYTKRTGCRDPGSPKITFFRPERTPCSSEHTAPARPPKRQYPFFFPPCQIHIFFMGQAYRIV